MWLLQLLVWGLAAAFAHAVTGLLRPHRKRTAPLQPTLQQLQSSGARVPALRIVLLVAGTRGDVQPAVALALRLQSLGHLVRLATHQQYKDFVLKAGVQHFRPLGGDPVALTKVTVASRGILPCSLGAFSIIRQQYKSLMFSLLAATTQPFTASDPACCKPSLIITTPITYGAAHVAEALDVPLHVISAVPWAPSKELPHPWARAWDMSWSDLVSNTLGYLLPGIKTEPSLNYTPPPTTTVASAHGSMAPLASGAANSSIASPATAAAHGSTAASAALSGRYMRFRSWLCSRAAHVTAWLSTVLLDHVVWCGIADLLMLLRVKQLKLWPWGKSQHGWCLYRCPTVFTFSPTLVPRPSDWPEHYTVSGQLQLSQAAPARDHPAASSHQRDASIGRTACRRLSPATSLELCRTLSLTDQDAPDFANFGLDDCDVHQDHTQVVGLYPAAQQQPAPADNTCDLSPAVCLICVPAMNDTRSSSLLPPQVMSFLNQPGGPPVYVGFGSAAVHDTPNLITDICQAAVNTNTRLLINRAMWVGVGSGFDDVAVRLQCPSRSGDSHVTAEGHVTAERLAQLVHVVDELPHDLLLPRCSAMVHHGGAGTVHAGLMAGIPTLVAPCYGDNYFWASVVHHLGAGPHPIPAHTLTAANLAQAFVELQDPRYKVAAQSVASQLTSDKGLDLAVQHIYRHFRVPAELAVPDQPATEAAPSRKSRDGHMIRKTLPGGGEPSMDKLVNEARLKLCRFWYG